MKAYIKYIIFLLLIVLISPSVADGQFISNPSFEGTTGQSYLPPGWSVCGLYSTPDTGPAVNSDWTTPSQGNSFLILLTRGNEGPYASHTEDCMVHLQQPLLTNHCYRFQIDVSHSSSYEANGVHYTGRVVLKIYGSQTGCSDTLLLMKTGQLQNWTWDTLDLTITPLTDINYLVLKADYAHLPVYNGNVELDNIRLTEIKENDTTLLETTVDYGASIILHASGGIHYNWSPADGLSCTDCPDPVASPPFTTTYTVSVTTDPPCYNHEEYFKIIVTPFIPNLTTPNGDGKNDFFRVGGLEPGSQITITDRWGKILYESDNYDNSWDGTYNGKLLPPDTYWYLLIFPSFQEPYKGYIVLKY